MPGVEVHPTLERRFTHEIHLLAALKLWKHGLESRKWQSCFKHGKLDGHVLVPLFLETIPVVDGGELSSVKGLAIDNQQGRRAHRIESQTPLQFG